MNLCAQYTDTQEGKEMIRLMNKVSGFDFFGGRQNLFYGLDEQLDTCVWNKHELKVFPEIKVVSLVEMILTLKAVKSKSQYELPLQ